MPRPHLPFWVRGIFQAEIFHVCIDMDKHSCRCIKPMNRWQTVSVHACASDRFSTDSSSGRKAACKPTMHSPIHPSPGDHRESNQSAVIRPQIACPPCGGQTASSGCADPRSGGGQKQFRRLAQRHRGHQSGRRGEGGQRFEQRPFGRKRCLSRDARHRGLRCRRVVHDTAEHRVPHA